MAAQKTTVSSFCKDGQIIGEYTDIESGTRKGNNREGLKQAIQQAKESECKLVIAKLDRLSRNVLFITTLMESGVDFVACDMPTANKFTIHIFAALAEQEADLISQRTKAALTELKKSGKRLGSPKNLTKAAIDKGKEIRINNAFENENNVKATALIRVLKESGLSLTNVALKLNESGFRTRRRKKFQAVQVQRLYNRYCILQK